MKSILAALAAAVVLSVSTAQAATLVVEGGQLTGATGVQFDGMSYSVEFRDGTCIELFDGCDEASDFAFNNAVDALGFADSLLDRVFINTGQGDFDDVPSLTSGCDTNFGAVFCQALIPFGVLLTEREIDGGSDDSDPLTILERQVQLGVAVNGIEDADLTRPGSLNGFFDTGDAGGFGAPITVFAVVTKQTTSPGDTEPGDTTPVIPLPAGAWLMLTGLGALAALRRRRR